MSRYLISHVDQSNLPCDHRVINIRDAKKAAKPAAPTLNILDDVNDNDDDTKSNNSPSSDDEDTLPLDQNNIDNDDTESVPPHADDDLMEGSPPPNNDSSMNIDTQSQLKGKAVPFPPGPVYVHLRNISNEKAWRELLALYMKFEAHAYTKVRLTRRLHDAQYSS